MEFKIGKTLYKSNLYLKNKENLINKSNIEYLSNKYSYQEVIDLSVFNKIEDTFILNKNLTSKFKRPKIIKYNESLFLRDDLFFKLNQEMIIDPVLDYNTFVKIEKEIEKNCLNELFSKLENVDYNKFIKSYENEKEKGTIEINLNDATISFKYNQEEKNYNRKIMKND